MGNTGAATGTRQLEIVTRFAALALVYLAAFLVRLVGAGSWCQQEFVGQLFAPTCHDLTVWVAVNKTVIKQEMLIVGLQAASRRCTQDFLTIKGSSSYAASHLLCTELILETDYLQMQFRMWAMNFQRIKKAHFRTPHSRIDARNVSTWHSQFLKIGWIAGNSVQETSTIVISLQSTGHHWRVLEPRTRCHCVCWSSFL